MKALLTIGERQFKNASELFHSADEKLIFKENTGLKERTQTETDISSSNQTMEEIWKDIPEDMYEAVITTFSRFRSICQNWNSLPNFNTFTLQFLPQPPWFYTATHENVISGAMYDHVSRKMSSREHL